MKLKIDMNNFEVSNDEVLKLLERSLGLDYCNSYVRDNKVWCRIIFTGVSKETNIPVDVYEAFCTVRKYLIRKD